MSMTIFTRAESTSSSSNLRRSWGNVGDTVSPAARSAWREQLLRRNCSRLAGIPMTVLLRQGIRRAEGCRVVTAPPTLSAELTARAVIAGTCAAVTPPSLAAPVSKAAERAPKGSVESCRAAHGGSRKGAQGGATGEQDEERDAEATTAVREERSLRTGDQGHGGAIAKSMGSGSASPGGSTPAPSEEGLGSASCSAPGSASTLASSCRQRSLAASTKFEDLPHRGFHLVDLHAVVRNCVEWSHCLPKVEACFRVGDNRDVILLDLLDALGGRLSCSSVHDFKAALAATRRASPFPALPPRLLDLHVCRSPALLRTSLTAGVQLYEVDCADEVRRICAARRAASFSAGRRSDSADAHRGDRSTPCRRLGEQAGPIELLIRLAVPYLSEHYPQVHAEAFAGDEYSRDPSCSDSLEASYGAQPNDVAEIVQAVAAAAAATAAAATVGSDGEVKVDEGKSNASVLGGSGSSSNPRRTALSIVGFSIDVGPACHDDAFTAATATAKQPTPPGLGSCDPKTEARRSKALPSAALTTRIGAAVAVAVKAARRAAETAATVTENAAVAPCCEKTTGKATGGDMDGSRNGSAGPMRPSPPSFHFRRLHVTGLGAGGARGEPLTALGSALSQHLPTAAGSGDGNIAAGSICKPVVVSADATEHLVASGVWSTVTSIIGRKGVAPADPASVRQGSSECARVSSSDGVGGGQVCSSGGMAATPGTVRRGGGGGSAMYFIDDGCYGSLSGALLRGVQMQPSPLVAPRGGDVETRIPPPLNGKTDPSSSDKERSRGKNSSAVLALEARGAAGMPCTVWGPTCDGLDCVSRVTPLPGNMKPGRDWLFFPDTGTRGGADATDFNGLKPLDCCYCIRQRDVIAASSPSSPFNA